MKTKEDLIIEAYGDHYELVKPYIDKDGWCRYHWQIVHMSYLETMCRSKPNERCRPVALKGIENNNGWNLIKDLDIEDNEYVLFLRMTEGGEPPIFTCPLGEDYQIGYFTHWKRIDYLNPPIF